MKLLRGAQTANSRIRFIRCSDFVSQIENFNRALTEISEASQYCKIVCADDYIFPEHLQLMVQAFEGSPSIGLVSSYCLLGDAVSGSGYPYPTPMLSGREVARRHLQLEQPYIFGTPTTVMYRSSVVRTQRPFYDKSALHADTDKCMEILAHWDFGFVHTALEARTKVKGTREATRYHGCNRNPDIGSFSCRPADGPILRTGTSVAGANPGKQCPIQDSGI